MRRFTPLAVVLALVAVACGDEPAATTTTLVTPTTIGSIGGVPDEITALIEETERIRGLEFVEPPTVTLLSDEALARRVHDFIDESLDEDELVVWQALYELLGLVDSTIDIGAAYRDLYAEQVGGFYDSDTGELVVGAGSELSPLARSIIVHELVHALTDQHFGFAAVVDELTDAGLHDEALAVQALAEGDATYFQLVYLQGLPIAEQIAAVEESLATDTTVLDSLPAWFAEDLAFPYDAGFRFATQLIEAGGVEQVNQAYRLLPQTTEQILRPDMFFTREPARPVNLPSFDLPGYEAFDEGTFGAWNLQLLLLDGVPDGDKAVAAAGWGGDRYRLYWDGSRVAFAYVYEADTPRDAEELAAALVQAAAATMGLGDGLSDGEAVTTFDSGPGFAQVRAGERRVVFVAADNASDGLALATAMAAAMPPDGAG